MNIETYERAKRWLIEESDRIERSKRPEYTIENADVLSNFKRVGEAIGVSPHVTAAVYARKHEDAIARIARNPMAETSEPVIGRFADRFNYLALQLALLIEEGYVTLPEGPETGPEQLTLPFEESL
jgi:hypothetical protein